MMNYTDIKIKRVEGKFRHNLPFDLACFAVWKAGRPFLADIRKALAEKFEILWETTVKWSEKNFQHNAARLYEETLDTANPMSIHARKIGTTDFVFFVVRDPHPLYTHAVSVSGNVEMSNLNIVKSKYKFRNIIKDKTGERYAVHSSNNIYEFFYQTTLIAGTEILDRLLQGEEIHIPVLNKDLEGADGWRDYDELFSVLNRCCSYLSFRDRDNLPAVNMIQRMAFLTDQRQRLVSAMGAEQGMARIAGHFVNLDIRYVGDKYFSTAWEKTMLDTKSFNGGIYIPRKDEHFFSLLFYCKVGQKGIRPEYYETLDKMARELNFHFFKKEDLEDDEKMGRLLKGYYEANGYRYEDPLEKGVFKNRTVASYLPQNLSFWKRSRTLRAVKKNVRRMIPDRVVTLVKSFLF